VPRLRRSGLSLLCDPDLTGWAKVWHASGVEEEEGTASESRPYMSKRRSKLRHYKGAG